MQKLKLALPKGSLQEATLNLFRKAGFRIHLGERAYFPVCDDPEMEIALARAQEIARYVADGIFDVGLTGHDWILESVGSGGAKLQEVCELIYAKSSFRATKWVIAVPQNSKIRKLKDLQGKRIATELVNMVRGWLKKNHIKAEVEFSWGATEAKAGIMVDAIVELTETGSSLAANNLRIVDTILTSTPRLIANKNSFKNTWRRRKIENLAILLKGALNAEGMVGLKLNLKEKDLKKVVSILPALKKPTISKLSQPGWIALEVILEEEIVKNIIPELKRAGAQGIIEYPLNKVIY